MKILGIDPGTIVTGYGLIEYDKNELIYLKSGLIKTPSTKEFAPRLQKIYDELNIIMKKNKPDEFALETAFYGKNVQSALKIGYARGVSLLAAAKNKIPIKEYSPREIKKSVVGNGASSKEQVQFMVKKLLSLRNIKIQFDETDALAVAICHAFKIVAPSRKSKNWKEFVEANPDKLINY